VVSAHAFPRSVLLLSGGLDSTALAQLYRPTLSVVIDYGQRCAQAETQAACAVGRALDLRVQTLRVDLTAIGAGLLADDKPVDHAPSPEWWPYRNQLLVTTGAALALHEKLDTVLVGTVNGDGERHVDGTPAFYDLLDRVISLQEGGIRVAAPALPYSSAELITLSGLQEDVAAYTVSCHRANLPCGTCPGCHKRVGVLRDVGMLCAPAQSGLP